MSKSGSTNQQTEKKPNPIVWFFFAILIPVIVAIIITVVILSIAGVDVGAWAKETGSNIPVVSNFVKTDEEIALEDTREQHNKAMEGKEQEISELQNIVDEQTNTIETLTQEALKLEQQIKSSEHLDFEEDIDVDRDETIKEMASSYRKMNAKQAAKIIEKMERSIALDLLHELSNDVRGKIIEEMSEEKAIEITEQYINQSW
ncbi:MAG TPA: hypothetical protein VK144_09895 [Bacillota bacterium]|nr:hypothetical protein [Bacillota bacterium]